MEVAVGWEGLEYGIEGKLQVEAGSITHFSYSPFRAAADFTAFSEGMAAQARVLRLHLLHDDCWSEFLPLLLGLCLYVDVAQLYGGHYSVLVSEEPGELYTHVRL